jgi:predicted transcriptional regulator
MPQLRFSRVPGVFPCHLFSEHFQVSSIVIFPCEKAVWYYLPQIRADLAKELVKSGMTQSEAAKKLGVTPAAVSQYLHKKRGLQPAKSQKYRQEIKAAAEKIREGTSKNELSGMVCNCCHLLQQDSGDPECG